MVAKNVLAQIINYTVLINVNLLLVKWLILNENGCPKLGFREFCPKKITKV